LLVIDPTKTSNNQDALINDEETLAINPPENCIFQEAQVNDEELSVIDSAKHSNHQDMLMDDDNAAVSDPDFNDQGTLESDEESLVTDTPTVNDII
jgi:hypothetical protein